MSDSTALCERLHVLLSTRPLYRWPIDWKALPRNGVYFFYEQGESWGHGGEHPRIVRVGTHREGNFVSRMKSHYVPDEKIEAISLNTSCCKDRSIFRKNIGRAILSKTKDAYLPIWSYDLTAREKRLKYKGERNVKIERATEVGVSLTLQKTFTFRVIQTPAQVGIMGVGGIEARLIGTVANCSLCRPSKGWLGHYSPDEKIRKSGLWLVQLLGSSSLEEKDWPKLAMWAKAGA